MTRRYEANINSKSKESILKFFEEHYDYTPQEIKLKYGIPVSTQNYWRRKAGIGKGRPSAFKDHIRRPIEVEKIDDPEIWDNGPWFKSMYQDKELGAHVIARMINRSVTVVYRRLKRFRIPIREHKQAVKPKNKFYNKQWLWENYVRDNGILLDIAKEAGVSVYTICNWLTDFGIPIRGKSDYFVIKTRRRKAKEYREKHGASVQKTKKQS